MPLINILFISVFVLSFVLMIVGAKLNNDLIKKIAYILSVILIFIMYKMFSDMGVLPK